MTPDEYNQRLTYLLDEYRKRNINAVGMTGNAEEMPDKYHLYIKGRAVTVHLAGSYEQHKQHLDSFQTK